MARIALITTGIVSHVNAGCELARRLQRGGHEIRFLVDLPEAQHRIVTEGFRCHPEAGRAPMPAGLGRVARARERLASRLSPSALQDFIADYRPDLVVVQSELHATIIWLVGQGLQPLLLEPDVYRRVAGVPPPDSGFIPRGGRLDRWRCAVAWRRLRMRRVLSRALNWLRLRGLDPVSRWQCVARANGVDLAALTTRDQWPLLFYPRLRYLYVPPAELDFPAGRSVSAGRIGPLIYRTRKTPDGLQDRHRLQGLIERRAAGGRPLVLCVMGSMLDLPDFRRRIAAAAAGAGFELVLAAPDAGGTFPPNIHVFEYLPQIDALAAASAVVCHGGSATVYESIDAGVPMLVCDGGLMFANGLATRVAAHGLGLRRPLRSPPAVLRHAIETLIHDPAYARRVAAMRRRLAHYESDRVALRLVEEALAAASDET